MTGRTPDIQVAAWRRLQRLVFSCHAQEVCAASTEAQQPSNCNVLQRSGIPSSTYSTRGVLLAYATSHIEQCWLVVTAVTVVGSLILVVAWCASFYFIVILLCMLTIALFSLFLPKTIYLRIATLCILSHAYTGIVVMGRRGRRERNGNVQERRRRVERSKESRQNWQEGWCSRQERH